jgi:hypothetical protein
MEVLDMVVRPLRKVWAGAAVTSSTVRVTGSGRVTSLAQPARAAYEPGVAEAARSCWRASSDSELFPVQLAAGHLADGAHLLPWVGHRAR